MRAGLIAWWRRVPERMSGWYLRRAQRLEAKAAWWRARAGPDAETLKRDLK